MGDCRAAPRRLQAVSVRRRDLPLVVMRRLDQVMEPTRDKVIARAEQLAKIGVAHPEHALAQVAGVPFYNTNKLRFHELLNDPGHIAGHLEHYIDGYSPVARQVIEKFDFDKQIERLVDGRTCCTG